MSDDLTSDGLGSSLRELATAGETPPPVAAPEIRRRAVRRGRRRRTALAVGAGAATLALAAFALTLNAGGSPAHRQAPAASPRLPSPSASSPVATPVTGTVNFAKRTVSVDGRALPITSGRLSPVSAGLLTVSAKLDLERDSVGELTKDACKAAEPYVVELRGADRSSLYVGSLACTPRGGTWIGLDTKDALWLYNRLEPGDTLSVAIAPRT
ncbi:hypothetical protein SRB17_61080 [Streptomyces sp. RB17]|uniref:hypothetical protein n=1 Tax=Streptomyces sp. RB17 TaxID=2585197 RepID=UPI001297D38D|nr:hypothetical protein [Streptomyces sp. RB17]MQY38100.1 hypothetical protein [Streptomyces sp. RB17]